MLLLLPAGAISAELTSSVDRNSININETLTLTLRYEESASSDSLELEVLRQDFDVLSVQPHTSNNVSIVNGNYSQQTLTTWTITLAPKREGTLVIPSFNIDGNVSDAIAIEVSRSSGAGNRDTPMLVTLDAETSQAYVGQQILITVELMAQENISNLSGGRLSLPNAHLELLDQQSFRRVQNGIAWQVVEWEYALIPEQSGMIEIPPQLFSGVMGATSNFGFPDPFNQRGRRISARSNAQQIEVLPPPETSGLPWFPARNVQINSSWSGDTSQARVGEPLTRTIEITATGQRASAIPPLPQPDSPAYKTYADQPRLQDQPSTSGIIGTRSESTAIVPSTAGELQLPE
ncbi:MAG: BatD family protein, partial [Gammaproteobacteria bacterium]